MYRSMVRVIAAAVVLAAGALSADWSPKLAAQCLGARQKEWFAWPQAASPDGPCVSCHTGHDPTEHPPIGRSG